MKSYNAIRKASNIRFYAGLLVVGLLLTALGAFLVTRPKRETYSVEATIDKIIAEYDSMNETYDYTIIIHYTDKNGESHSGIEYYGYNSSMKEGGTTEVLLDAEDPELVSSPGSGVIKYVVLLAGLGFLAAAISGLVKHIKAKDEDMDELDRTKLSAATPEMVEAVRNDDSPVGEFYFHYTGKMGQSYVLETPSRTPYFTGHCDKLGFGWPSVFTFENCRTGQSVTNKVSATVTQSTGDGHVEVITDSHFKIDGVNNWDDIGKRGYSMEPHIEGLHISMTVFRYGVEVGTIESAGANILRDDKQYKLGNIPAKGLYTVKCKESDIEGFFMICFSCARTGW